MTASKPQSRPCFFCRLGLSLIAPFSLACHCDHKHNWQFVGVHREGEDAASIHRCSVCRIGKLDWA